MTDLGTMRFAVLALALAGCAGPEPVLYGNNHLTQVGRTQADNDIALCRQLAEEAGATRDPSNVAATAKTTGTGAVIGAAAGAVGGAIGGNAGIGAAVGAASGATAGLLQSLFSGPAVSQVHKNYVDRCLRERGYDPMGWQ